jgi:hypothetical protein
MRWQMLFWRIARSRKASPRKNGRGARIKFSASHLYNSPILVRRHFVPAVVQSWYGENFLTPHTKHLSCNTFGGGIPWSVVLLLAHALHLFPVSIHLLRSSYAA